MFNPGVRKIPWRRAWQYTSIFLPAESPWTEEPDGPQSIGSHRLGHDWSNLAQTHVMNLEVSCGINGIHFSIESAHQEALTYLNYLLYFFSKRHEHNTWGGKLFVVKEIKTEFKHVFLFHILIIFSSHNSILVFYLLCPDGKCAIKFIQPELIIFL